MQSDPPGKTYTREIMTLSQNGDRGRGRSGGEPRNNNNNNTQEGDITLFECRESGHMTGE